MDCRYFDGCSAPLCPRDEGIAARTWFPDEPVCRLADVPDWVKRQRRIARKAAPGGYFTLAMLRHDCRICTGIKGIDPDGTDKERADSEAAWFTAHPVITEADREIWRAMGERQTAILLRARTQKTRSSQGSDAISGQEA
jgi:hypothetical protein